MVHSAMMRVEKQQCCNLKWLLVVSVMPVFFPGAISNTPNLIDGSWYNFRMPEFADNQTQQGLSDTCKDQLSHVRLKDVEKAIDASGKPGAGILRGNVFWLGSFDECDHIRDFHYCLVAVNLSGIAPEEESLQRLPLLYGVCIPDKCSETDISCGFDDLLAITGLSKTLSLSTFHKPLCSKDPHRPYDDSFKATVAFFSILFLMVAGSSLYHAWYHSSACRKSEVSQLVRPSEPSHLETSPLLQSSVRSVQITPDGPAVYGSERQDEAEINLEAIQKQREGKVSTFNQLIFCFAVPHNLQKLLSGNKAKESIPCIHGIRVISMLWVILGHTFIFTGIIGGMNPLKFEEWIKRYGFMVISNAYFCVDSFFVLSGLLVTYLTLTRMKKQGRINWFLFYFHRYWRLTPVLAVTMLFYVYITPYFGHGPYAQIASERPLCSENWWANLLYINNFYPVKGVNMCIGWVWYLANDMQFFIISPLILIPLYYFPLLGFYLLGLLCFISVTVTGILVAVHRFPADMHAPRPPGPSFADVVYNKPYCRITPYLVGMVLGYVLYKYPKKSFRMHWFIVLLCWVISCGMGYACVYSVYTSQHGHAWPLSANVFYEMFCRLAWGIFVAWVIFACNYGYGGWVNSFLAHPAWAPLGRLSYTVYMIHPVMITLFGSHQGSALHLSLALMAFYYAGITLISFGCSVIFSLMIEFPLAGLENLFLKRR